MVCRFNPGAVLLFCLLALCIGLTGCEQVDKTARGVVNHFQSSGSSGSLEGSYKLPIVPLKITYNFTTHAVRVAISDSITTPIGTFALSAGSTFENNNPGQRVLKVVMGNQILYYPLNKNRRYDVSLPSDLYGKSRVEILPGGNIRVLIPNPTTETVAELRNKLKQAETARLRAEEALGRVQASQHTETTETDTVTTSEIKPDDAKPGDTSTTPAGDFHDNTDQPDPPTAPDDEPTTANKSDDEPAKSDDNSTSTDNS